MGGAQTHVKQLTEYFRSQGHEVGIISNNDEWLREKTDAEYFVNPYFSNSYNPIQIYKAIKFTKKIIKEFKPDIIHCHSSFAGIVGRLASKNEVPTFFTAHGWSFNEGVPFFQKIFGIFSEKLVSKYTTKIIACAGFVKDLGVKYGLDADKMEVIYNGVEIEDFDFNSKPFENRIITVMRLAPPKDPFLLSDAFRKVSTDTELVIIGDGPGMGKLKEAIKDCTNIKVVGLMDRPDVFFELKKAGYFALCSHWEGFPYTILEAMSYGCAIISSDVGGVNEALAGGAGILVDNNIEDWTKQLKILLSNKERSREMAKKAYDRAREVFSLEIMFKKVENLYKQYVK